MSNNDFKQLLASASKERQAALDKLIQNDCVQEPKVSGRKNKVRINLTVSEETRDQLFKYAEEQGLSASVIVQMMVKKYCK